MGEPGAPDFGATVVNNLASHDNPHRVGRFVRVIRRRGRMNPGVWWQLTNGRGVFWEVRPDSCEVASSGAGTATSDDETELLRAELAAARAGIVPVHAGALALALHDADCGCPDYDEVEDSRYITAVETVLNGRDATAVHAFDASVEMAKLEAGGWQWHDAFRAVALELLPSGPDVDPDRPSSEVLAELRALASAGTAALTATPADTTPEARQ